MAKDYRTWWRIGHQTWLDLFEEVFTPTSYGITGGHLIESLSIDIDDWHCQDIPDEVFEQLWAIHEGLA